MSDKKKKFNWRRGFLIIIGIMFFVFYFDSLYNLGVGSGIKVLLGILLWVFGIGWLVQWVSKW